MMDTGCHPGGVGVRRSAVVFTARLRLQDGYSLTRVLVGMGVFAVVAAASLPAVVDTMRTYQQEGAAREVLSAIRAAQSEAVTRGGIVAFHWGADPGVGRPPAEYRIARDTTGSCGFPAAEESEDGATVIRGWRDLSREYPGTSIQSILDATSKPLSNVMFDALGASVNTCTSVSFPITVTVAAASGETRTIEIRTAGSTSLP